MLDFELEDTTHQVDRHFRQIEKWNWIKLVLDNSGYGFDAASCNASISEAIIYMPHLKHND